MDSFNRTILIHATHTCVYEALTTSITKWWTEMFDGVSTEQGQTFTVRFGPNVFKTMVVEELILNKRVVWSVTDSIIDLPELRNKTEWIDTMIVWEIFSQENKTRLQLTHIGLTPKIECYTICQSGWDNFTESLKSFVDTGTGQPFRLP